MSPTPPPILPTSTPATIPTTTTTFPTTQPSTTTTPPLRAFITSIHNQATTGLTNLRPWSEFVALSAFSKPESITDATTRLRKNYHYFYVNYITIITLTLAISLITHPFSLFTLATLLAAWCFLYLFKPNDQPLLLFNREFSDKETLGILLVLSVFAIFLTSVGSVLMSALVVGLAIVCVHGAFFIPDDLFLDDQVNVNNDGASVGFLSFLGTATKTASAASSRPASRV